MFSHVNEWSLLAVLQLRLQQRRTREQLVDQGIMPRKTLFLVVRMTVLNELRAEYTK